MRLRNVNWGGLGFSSVQPHGAGSQEVVAVGDHLEKLIWTVLHHGNLLFLLPFVLDVFVLSLVSEEVVVKGIPCFSSSFS